MQLDLYSKGLYSTWIFYPTDNLLFDCGEGCSSTLGNRIYAVEKIFLSHGHTDHIAGLPNFINTRNLSMGDKKKAIDIFYPQGSQDVERMREYISYAQTRLQYKLNWKPVNPGFEIEVAANRKIRCFKANHGRALAMGFSINEDRKRLKPQYQGLSKEEYIKLRKDNVDINEHYRKKLLVYSGDAFKIPDVEAMDADVLIHDVTFLNGDERREFQDSNGDMSSSHATLQEVEAFAKRCNIKKTVGMHVSPRYSGNDVKELKLPENFQVVPPGKFWNLDL